MLCIPYSTSSNRSLARPKNKPNNTRRQKHDQEISHNNTGTGPHASRIRSGHGYLDTDDSGTLSKEELAKVIPEERVDRAFSRWDADENGEISEEEFDNRPPPPGMGG